MPKAKLPKTAARITRGDESYGGPGIGVGVEAVGASDAVSNQTRFHLTCIGGIVMITHTVVTRLTSDQVKIGKWMVSM
jgi:hypothetical protein